MAIHPSTNWPNALHDWDQHVIAKPKCQWKTKTSHKTWSFTLQQWTPACYPQRAGACINLFHCRHRTMTGTVHSCPSCLSFLRPPCEYSRCLCMQCVHQVQQLKQTISPVTRRQAKSTILSLSVKFIAPMTISAQTAIMAFNLWRQYYGEK